MKIKVNSLPCLYRCKGNAIGQKYFRLYKRKQEYVGMAGLLEPFAGTFKLRANLENQKANNTPE